MPVEDNAVRESFILSLLREQIIPGAKLGARLVLACNDATQLQLPDGIAVTAAGKLGRKVVSRGRRAYSHHISIAQWPDDGQEALRVPMLWRVSAGTLHLRLGEYCLHVPAGYSILIPSGIPAPWGMLHPGPNEFCDVCILTPRGRQLQCRLRQYRKRTVDQIESISLLNTALTDNLDRIVEELCHPDLNAAEIASHSLLILWLTLERELAQRRYVDVMPRAFQEEDALPYNPISAAQRYMQTHLHHKLTIDTVCQSVHLSRTQFNALFQQQTGQTFVEYLTTLRLEWACRLLQETGWSVYYISTFVGFTAPAYFHRLFRRKMGMTPNEYRSRKSTFSDAVERL